MNDKKKIHVYVKNGKYYTCDCVGKKKKVKDPKVLGIGSQETIEDIDEEEKPKKE